MSCVDCRYSAEACSDCARTSAAPAALVVLVELGPCYECPFCHDGSSCRAFRGGEYDTGVHSGRSAHEHADGRSCDPYSERPDWCPLPGGVEVRCE